MVVNLNGVRKYTTDNSLKTDKSQSSNLFSNSTSKAKAKSHTKFGFLKYDGFTIRSIEPMIMTFSRLNDDERKEWRGRLFSLFFY